MIHIYKKGKNDNTLLLLHGTGGSEEDLLPIAKFIDNEANLLSVRGNVLEGHMYRFFKRIRPGIFDIEDLERRTIELHEFINEASIRYGFDRNKVIALGYSNGANIAANLLFSIANTFKGAILLRPTIPQNDKKIVDLKDVYIYISSGEYDSLCTKEDVVLLESLFNENNANVTLKWVNANHSLTYEEFNDIRNWYNTYLK